MFRLKKHISPALILSIVAIFIALGGGAYAALNANSVGSKQLRKNAVTTKKIKNKAIKTSKIAGSAVTTSRIKNEAVNGSKVLERSLSQVPSADQADLAALATNLAGYERLGARRATPSFSNPVFNVALAGATEIPLFDLAPVTIYGKCFKVGTSLYGGFYIKTSVDGVAFDSDADSLYGSPYLNVGTSELDREVMYTSVGPNAAHRYSSAKPTVVLTPDGKSYRTSNAVFVKQGSLPSGDGPYGPGDACFFLGEGGES
ncbi:MAG: hypothetical protein WBP55_12275 [Solirubrobacterales bacterium]